MEPTPTGRKARLAQLKRFAEQKRRAAAELDRMNYVAEAAAARACVEKLDSALLSVEQRLRGLNGWQRVPSRRSKFPER